MIAETEWVSLKMNELTGMIGKLMTRVEQLETQTKNLMEELTCKKQN